MPLSFALAGMCHTFCSFFLLLCAPRLTTHPPLQSSFPAIQYYSAPETVMEKVGIGLDGQKTTTLKDTEKLACRICCDEFTGKEAYALACNHFFCRGCWAAYLSAKVNKTG